MKPRSRTTTTAKLRLHAGRAGLATLLLARPLVSQPSASLSPAVVQRVDSVAMAELRAARVPGATLAIVIGDSVVYRQAYGRADVEAGAPMRPDLVFRLGSTTKMMTALAAVQLAAAGTVRLDQPIGELAPDITAPRLRALTLRQLLTHTAGLLDYTSMSGPHDDIALTAFVPTLTDTAFFTAPSDVFSYSNLGFAIAGHVLSRATGKPYADVMQDEVFKPLGMARSTMRPIEAMTFPLAQGHAADSAGFSVIRPAPDDARYWPAGSAFSTVTDLSQLAIALLNGGRVRGAATLSPEVVATLLTPQVAVPGVPGRPTVRYAFGLNVTSWGRYRMVEHGGSRAGYGSLFRLLPDERAAIVILANRSGASLNLTMEAATEAIAGEARGASEPAPDPTPPASGWAESLAGRWSNGPSSWVEVAARGDAATLAASDGRRPVPLQATGPVTFRAGTQSLLLTTGADGRTRYLMIGSRAYRKADVASSPTKR